MAQPTVNAKITSPQDAGFSFDNLPTTQNFVGVDLGDEPLYFKDIRSALPDHIHFALMESGSARASMADAMHAQADRWRSLGYRVWPRSAWPKGLDAVVPSHMDIWVINRDRWNQINAENERRSYEAVNPQGFDTGVSGVESRKIETRKSPDQTVTVGYAIKPEQGN